MIIRDMQQTLEKPANGYPVVTIAPVRLAKLRSPG